MTFSKTGVISDHQMSGELDIIIYDSTNYSTIFKDKDIVVLRPESVRVIIEVKSALNYKQKDDFMGSSGFMGISTANSNQNPLGATVTALPCRQ